VTIAKSDVLAAAIEATGVRTVWKLEEWFQKTRYNIFVSSSAQA
jgi:hypothetical protein